MLGSGGFGEVMLARHDASGLLVAIKYLRPELLADPDFAEMFRGEATALASIDDPNVVRLYEYVESPSGAAIVMELIDGVSLREILARHGSTTAEAALVVLQGSLLGLAAAHYRGLVHRDYKPENVLVDEGGASKLTDFGLAARAGDRPIPAGTLLYVAPEQIAGAPASPASDVYSATATFYECVTGHPPFSGESAELLRQHRSEPVPLEPVPEPLRPIVTAGMAKDPNERPTDAVSFVTSLRAVAAGSYGPDWERRGRSHLGEAALLLAALWPSGAAPAVQATAVHKVPLIRHFSLLNVGVAIGVVVAVITAGVTLAANRSPVPQSQPRVQVQSVPLQTSSSESTGQTVSTPPVTPAPITGSSAPPPPPPPQPTSVPITVTASGGWVATGITLNAGDSVAISASGSWTADGTNYTGPDGYSTTSADNFFNTTDLGACAYCATTQTEEWGALISYTGGSPPPTGSYTSTDVAADATLISLVGSQYSGNSQYAGELWLGFNDDAYSNYTSDNAGQVTATISVTPG